MEVNVRDYNTGTLVSTKDGVGRILFFTDYKPVEIEDRIEIQPKSAVVLFDDHSASKYPMDQLSIAEQPTKAPSSQIPETVERTILPSESTPQDTLEQAE
jgi:hypothetical protein